MVFIQTLFTSVVN